jgi:archaemetzincin
MSLAKTRFAVVPFGVIPEIVVKSIGAHIQAYLDIHADILPPLSQPEYAFDKRRLQYDAGFIIKALDSEAFHNHDKVIGVLDVDIFVPILTHVFGEAKQGGKSALVSIYRLKDDVDADHPPTALVLERAAKVALHEAGHLFNLFHCMDEKCLMGFSGSLSDLDLRPLFFCRYCHTFLRDAFRRP